jgi:hypothetical protein
MYRVAPEDFLNTAELSLATPARGRQASAVTRLSSSRRGQSIMSRGSDSSVLRVALRQRSVQPGRSEQVHLSIPGRNPPPKHDAARAPHREQVAIPRGLRGVGGHGAVGAAIVNELRQIIKRRRVHPITKLRVLPLPVPASSASPFHGTSSTRWSDVPAPARACPCAGRACRGRGGSGR